MFGANERIVDFGRADGTRQPVEDLGPPKQGFGLPFCHVFIHEWGHIARRLRSGAALRLLFLVPSLRRSHAFSSFRPLNQRMLAAELELTQASISLALNELLAVSVLQRQGKGPATEWRLSPRWGWDLKASAWKREMRALGIDPQTDVLMPGRVAEGKPQRIFQSCLRTLGRVRFGRIKARIIDGGVAARPRAIYGRDFLAVFNGKLADLAHKIRSATTLRVFMVLPLHLTFEEFTRLNQRMLAAELELTQASISLALNELHAMRVIERQGTGPMTKWRLVSDWYWAGSAGAWKSAQRKRGKNAAAVALVPRAGRPSAAEDISRPEQRKLRLLAPIIPGGQQPGR